MASFMSPTTQPAFWNPNLMYGRHAGQQVTLAKPQASPKKETVKRESVEVERSTVQQIGDFVSQSSAAALVLFSGLLLFSPLIAKQAGRLHQNPANLPEVLKSEKALKALKALSDAEQLKDRLLRINHAIGLVNISSSFQTSINTQQPSKFVGSIFYLVRSLSMVFRPNAIAQNLAFLGGAFWYAGERNDIENSNHSSTRRERDLSSLWKFSSKDKKSTWLKDFKETRQFIDEDNQYAFSRKPWKELFKNIWKKETWSTSQSWQTALGAQLSGISWICTMSGLAITNRQLLKQKFQQIVMRHEKQSLPLVKKVIHDTWQTCASSLDALSKITAAFSVSVVSLPLGFRAWQSRNEMDGKLTLLGIPGMVIGRAAMASPQLKTGVGLGGLGAPLVNEGKRLNSQKYRALINYFKALHQQALQNPNLTAKNTLDALRSNPAELKRLTKEMGQVRVNYLMDILKAGIQKQRNENLNFASFLWPITQSSLGGSF